MFDGGLAANQAANFPWWQDDHNFYIDLKVMLPLRHACQELARRVGADHRDDMLYLFWPELLERGRRPALLRASCGAWSRPGGSTSTTGTPGAARCPRCWAPSRSRSRTRC